MPVGNTVAPNISWHLSSAFFVVSLPLQIFDPTLSEIIFHWHYPVGTNVMWRTCTSAMCCSRDHLGSHMDTSYHVSLLHCITSWAVKNFATCKNVVLYPGVYSPVRTSQEAHSVSIK
jgi:hypothetical protein